MSTFLVKLSEDLASCSLTQKAAHLEASVWTNVEDIARQLANGLRSHGQTGLCLVQRLLNYAVSEWTLSSLCHSNSVRGSPRDCGRDFLATDADSTTGRKSRGNLGEGQTLSYPAACGIICRI